MQENRSCNGCLSDGYFLKPSTVQSAHQVWLLPNETCLGKNNFWPASKKPFSTSTENSTFGADLLLLLTSKICGSNISGWTASIRFCATLIYLSSLSSPIQFLCNRFATAPVVPLPKNGSRTTSPGLLDERITRYNKGSGFCVVCALSPFSSLTRSKPAANESSHQSERICFSSFKPCIAW